MREAIVAFEIILFAIVCSLGVVSRRSSLAPFGALGVGFGADDEVRTRDIHLGKVVLYRLSYIRMCVFNYITCIAVGEIGGVIVMFHCPELPQYFQLSV